MKRLSYILTTLIFLLAFGSSHAAGYFGVSVGATSPDEDGFDDSNGYKITGGYNVNPTVAIEVSYTQLGEFDADDELIAALEFLTAVAIDDVSVEIDGIEFGVVGHAPISDSASIFGRVGIFMWDAELTIDTTAMGSTSDSDDGSDPFFGFGINFDVGQTTALKAEYVVYDAFDGDVDYIGAGLDIRF